METRPNICSFPYQSILRTIFKIYFVIVNIHCMISKLLQLGPGFIRRTLTGIIGVNILSNTGCPKNLFENHSATLRLIQNQCEA